MLMDLLCMITLVELIYIIFELVFTPRFNLWHSGKLILLQKNLIHAFQRKAVLIMTMFSNLISDQVNFKR
jgi:hypothetical protein